MSSLDSPGTDTHRSSANAVLIATAVALALIGLGWTTLRSLGVVGYRYRQVDVLSSPAQVATWTTNGLVLADGRTVVLPGVKQIDAPAKLLARVVERGVEVQPNGRANVLVRCYSGCGNCVSMKEQRLKVDLSLLLIYIGLAQPSATVKRTMLGTETPRSFRAELEEARDWEWGLRHIGGEFWGLEDLCNENEIPLAPHAEREFAGYW